MRDASEPSDARRRSARTARSSIPIDIARAGAVAAASSAAALAHRRNARRIGVYRSFEAELATAPLIERCRAAGHETSAPRLGEDGRLEFVIFDDHSTWAPNRFGIAEPSGPSTPAHLLDLVFVPAVAVDPRGNRLGMGGGWYDRTFSDLAARRAAGDPTCYLVAFVHDEQVLDRIEPHEWDVPVDAIVTPTITIEVSGAGGTGAASGGESAAIDA